MSKRLLSTFVACGMAFALGLGGCASRGNDEVHASRREADDIAVADSPSDDATGVSDAQPVQEETDGGIWVLSSYDAITTGDNESHYRMTYEIDDHGNVLAERDESVSDEEAYETRYSYDGDGYRTSVTSSESDEEKGVTCETDADGRILSESNGYGARKTYTYDDGRLVFSHEEEGKFSYDTGYDEMGNIAFTKSSSGYGRECSYEVDASGIVTGVTVRETLTGGEPSGEYHVSYSRDGNGNITQATFSRDGVTYQTSSYEYRYIATPSKGAVQYARMPSLAYIA